MLKRDNRHRRPHSHYTVYAQDSLGPFFVTALRTRLSVSCRGYTDDDDAVVLAMELLMVDAVADKVIHKCNILVCVSCGC